PASGSRPMHRRRDHRQGSRRPALDRTMVARQRIECRHKRGRDDHERIGTATRSPGAPPTREEAQDAPWARRHAASKLGIYLDERTSGRGTRQNQDIASGRSCACVCAVASTAAVPEIVSESVPYLEKAAAERVHARRSVLLSTHL